MSVGKRIKEIRTKKNLSLQELSKKVDISISFLSDIETERSNPSPDRLKNIAKALDMPVSYFIEEKLKVLPSPEQKIKDAISDDPELSHFWQKLSQRDDLELLFRQTKDMSPRDIKKIMQLIKIIEDEEAAEDL